MLTQAGGIIISNTSLVISTYGESLQESLLEMELAVRKGRFLA